MKHSKEIGAGCRPGLWSRMKKKKSCYLFLLPFFLLFTVFTVIPVVVAIGLSFTQYNVLEAPQFIGAQNYIQMIFYDDLLPTVLQNIIAGGTIARSGVSAAVALLLIIPPLITFILSQSNILETMSTSGMKD